VHQVISPDSGFILLFSTGRNSRPLCDFAGCGRKHGSPRLIAQPEIHIIDSGPVLPGLPQVVASGPR